MKQQTGIHSTWITTPWRNLEGWSQVHKVPSQKNIKECHTNVRRTSTLLTQQSVPKLQTICLLNNDPSDSSVLTPGHFLIGDALLEIP